MKVIKYVALCVGVFGLFGIQQVTLADETESINVIANTHVGDGGRVVDSFELKLESPEKYQDLVAEDFEIIGNTHDKIFDSQEDAAASVLSKDFENDEIELSIEENILTIKMKPFRFEGNPATGTFEVISEKYPELSFGKDTVTEIKTKTADDFVTGTFTSSDGVTLPYRLYLPESSKPVPLMLWIHGGGEYGQDNNVQIIANRGATTWVESGIETAVLSFQRPVNYGWGIEDNHLDQLAEMQSYNKLEYEFINQLIKEGKIDSSRIYLSGVSSGGGVSLQFLTQYPDLFAAALIICAKDALVPMQLVEDKEAQQPLFEEKLNKPELVNTPLWFVSATNDPTCTYLTTQYAFDALKKLGNTTNKLTLYSDEEMAADGFYGATLHWSWAKAFNDSEMINWMYSQKKVEEEPEEPTIPSDTSETNTTEDSTTTDTSSDSSTDDTTNSSSTITSSSSSNTSQTSQSQRNNNQSENNSKSLPKTGETNSLVLVLSGMVVLAVVYFLWKKKKNKLIF